VWRRARYPYRTPPQRIAWDASVSELTRKLTRALWDATQGFDAVHEQIEQHLLHLDAVAHTRGSTGLNLRVSPNDGLQLLALAVMLAPTA